MTKKRHFTVSALKEEIIWIKIFCKDIIANRSELSFFTKLFAYRKGFLPSIMNYSGINRKNYSEFLSSKDYTFKSSPNGIYSRMAEIKLNIPYLLKDYISFVPEYYFFKDECGFLPLENYQGKKANRLTINEFIDLLNEKQCLACKPCNSRWGEGFIKIEIKNQTILLNNTSVSLTEMIKTITELNDYIITEYVQQHAYAQKIYPYSANTIRLLCIWNSEKNVFTLVRAFHRFGTNKQVVDNLKSGSGLAVFMDLETGKLSNKILANFEKKGYRAEPNLYHPDSKIYLPEIEIPNWTFLKEKIVEISNHISFLKYLGYDIVITDTGFKILEINSKVGMNTLQFNDPLLNENYIKKTIFN